MRRFWLLFSVLLAAAWTPAGAKVRLPAVVGDNMVLQQATDVKVWGWAAPGSEVRVAPSWGGCRADGGRRRRPLVHDAAHACGVVRKRTIRIGDGDGEPVVLRNVLIGEVWLCSGQSNMEIPVQGGRDCPIEHSLEIIAESAQYPDVRLFSVKIDGGLTPREDVTGAWCEASPATVKTFSAVGYLFGRNLRRALGVPVGIINSSCGGTWIEAWFPAELQKHFGDFDPASLPHARGAERHDDCRDSLQRHDLSAAQLRHQGLLLVSGLHERRTQHLLRREDGGDDRPLARPVGRRPQSRSTTSRSLRWRTASRTWTARWCANSRPG